MTPKKVINEIQPELMSLNALPGAAGSAISSKWSLMYGSHFYHVYSYYKNHSKTNALNFQTELLDDKFGSVNDTTGNVDDQIKNINQNLENTTKELEKV